MTFVSENPCPRCGRLNEMPVVAPGSQPIETVEAALRAALNRERETSAKLRAFANMVAKIAVEMSDDDDLGLSVELEYAGLIDEEGNPTALLSGREDER